MIFGKVVQAFIVVLSVGLSLAFPNSATADYRLAPGDVIEFSAVGLSELRQRSRVDPNGEISLPLIGQIKASGLSLSELRSEVKTLIPTKSLRRKTPQGLDIVVVDPDDITLEVAEYRPIYVSGDVDRPGEQLYRVGITIRQAVAVCGGYSLRRFQGDHIPASQSADLRAEYQNLWTEYALAQVRTWRVTAELNGKTSLNDGLESLGKLPIELPLSDQILSFERQKLATNQATFERERDSLTLQLQQSDEQITLVQEQLGKTKEGAQLALAELQRVQSSYEKGVIPITRVSEERRYTLMAQTQNLQTTERLGQLRKEREELVRKLSELEVGRRANLDRELQEAAMQLSSIKTRLASIDAKLLFTISGSLRPPPVSTAEISAKIAVVRKTLSGYERVVADEDTEIQPGDTVVVSLSTQPGPAAAR